jgi:hydroxymethylbilane synthase
MAQANSLVAILEPHVGSVEVVKIRTSGDAGHREKLGAFVSEIEEALLSGRVDVGLHCLKDIPTREIPGLKLAAFLEREDPRDAILTRHGQFSDLPVGAVIGTGSLRRTSQLAAHGKSFKFKPLLGNVDTRMAKLQSGEYDAIVLAIAGLKRLGLMKCWSQTPYSQIVVEPLEVTTMTPAPGQATLVLQTRAEGPEGETLSRFNHLDTEICSIAERAFLARFGGGCSVPVGAYAQPIDRHYVLEGLIASPDGRVSYRGSKPFGSEQAAFYGSELSEELGKQGGFEILDAVGQAANR